MKQQKNTAQHVRKRNPNPIKESIMNYIAKKTYPLALTMACLVLAFTLAAPAAGFAAEQTNYDKVFTPQQGDSIPVEVRDKGPRPPDDSKKIPETETEVANLVNDTAAKLQGLAEPVVLGSAVCKEKWGGEDSLDRLSCEADNVKDILGQLSTLGANFDRIELTLKTAAEQTVLRLKHAQNALEAASKTAPGKAVDAAQIQRMRDLVDRRKAEGKDLTPEESAELNFLYQLWQVRNQVGKVRSLYLAKYKAQVARLEQTKRTCALALKKMENNKAILAEFKGLYQGLASFLEEMMRSGTPPVLPSLDLIDFSAVVANIGVMDAPEQEGDTPPEPGGMPADEAEALLKQMSADYN